MDDESLAAGPLHSARRRLRALLLAAIVHDDLCAGLGESDRDALTDPGGRAGDDRDLAGEIKNRLRHS